MAACARCVILTPILPESSPSPHLTLTESSPNPHLILSQCALGYHGPRCEYIDGDSFDAIDSVESAAEESVGRSDLFGNLIVEQDPMENLVEAADML